MRRACLPAILTILTASVVGLAASAAEDTRAPSNAADRPCSPGEKQIPAVADACDQENGQRQAMLVMKNFVIEVRALYYRRTRENLPLSCRNCHVSIRNLNLRDRTLDAEPFTGGNSALEFYETLAEAAERWRRTETQTGPARRRPRGD